MSLSFQKEQCKGIRKVEKKAERVYVDNAMSIEVPVGYSYTVDPIYLPESENSVVLIAVQKTESSDFDVYDNAGVSITMSRIGKHNMYSTKSDDIRKVAANQVESMPGGGELRECGEGVWATVTKKPIEVMGRCAYSAICEVVGDNGIYTLTAIFNTDEITDDEQNSFLDLLLGSICSIPTASRMENDQLSVLHKSFVADFSANRYVDIDGNAFRVPVPDGFSNRPEELGNPMCAILPAEYAFSGTVFDPKIGFMVRAGVSIDPYDPSKCNKVLDERIEAINIAIPNFIDDDNPITTVRKTEKGLVIYQSGLNSDETRYNYSVLIYTGSKVYISNFVVSMGRKISGDAKKWDAAQIAAAWLGRILFPGEEMPKVRQQSLIASSKKGAAPTTSATPNLPPLSVAKTERLFDHVEIALPKGYTIQRSKNDDGEEQISVVADRHKNDEGKYVYGIDISISASALDRDDLAKYDDVEKLRRLVDERDNCSAWIVVPGNPAYALFTWSVTATVLIFETTMYILTCQMILPDGNQLILFDKVMFFNGESDEEDMNKLYKNMLDVVRMLRIDGKEVTIPATYSEIQDHIEGGAQIVWGRKDTKRSVNLSKLRVDPDANAHTYFDTMDFPATSPSGNRMIFMKTTPDHVFVPLKDVNATGNDAFAALTRILNADKGGYSLHEKALETAPILARGQEAFKTNRETQIRNGELYKVQSLHLLRSFAWLTAAICAEREIEPEDLTKKEITGIVKMVEDRRGLNYNEAYCRGLCSGTDMHLVYMPDGANESDRRTILAGIKPIGMSETKMQGQSLDALRSDLLYISPAVLNLAGQIAEDDEPVGGIMAYTDIPSSIVYAWCSLANAARVPFMIDVPQSDTGSNPVVSGSQTGKTQKPAGQTKSFGIADEVVDDKTDGLSDMEEEEQNAIDWMEAYGPYVEKSPQIDFDGKLFAFSGLPCMKAEEKEQPLVKRVIAKGGQYRSSVSGKTDYLIVDPKRAGITKSKNAVEQKKKGSGIQIILMQDLVDILDGKRSHKQTDGTAQKPMSKESDANQAKKPKTAAANSVPSPVASGERVFDYKDESEKKENVTTPKKASAPKPATTKPASEDPTKKVTPPKPVAPNQQKARTASKGKEFKIVNGVLKKYSGDAERVVIPDGVTVIGDNAFEKCASVRVIVAPKSLREIRDWAFSECEKLESVELFDEVEYIERNVFYRCKSLRSFIVPGNTSILNISLRGCESLKWIVLHEYIDTIWSGFDVPKGITVYGELPPESQKLKYQLEWDNCIVREHQMPSGVTKPVCTLTPEQRYQHHYVIRDGELVAVYFNEYRYSKSLEPDELICGVLAIPQGVTKVAAYDISIVDFLERYFISEIILPNSLKEIEGGFDEIKGLRRLEIPYGITRLGYGGSFVENCESLKYVTLPDSMERLGKQNSGFPHPVFVNCPELTSINIPKSVTYIHRDSFSGCPKLTIYGERGTKAEEFARSKGIPFRTGLPQGVPTPRVENDARPIQRATQVRNAEVAKMREKYAEIERERSERERQRQQEEARRLAAQEQQRLEAERRAQEARQRAEEQRRREAEVAQLTAEKQQLLLVIEHNQGGLFGEKARNRRQAKARLAEIESRLKYLT